MVDYQWVGNGRDDGKQAGEHCPIFYREKRFQNLDSGTFWLSGSPDKPSRTWGNQYYRICSYVQLQERASKRSFWIFNTHYPLMKTAREKSAKLLVKLIQKKAAQEPVILVGDFNCGPESKPWKTFKGIGLKHAGNKNLKATYHKFGFPLVIIDAIFASPGWTFQDYSVLRDKVGGTFPSDHFGLRAKLQLIDKSKE